MHYLWLHSCNEKLGDWCSVITLNFSLMSRQVEDSKCRLFHIWMTTPNSQLSSSGLQPSLHSWPILSNTYQTKGLTVWLSVPVPSRLLSFPVLPSLLFSHPWLLFFHCGSHSPFLPVLSPSLCLPSTLPHSPLPPVASLSYCPPHPPLSTPPSRSPPPFILGSPTVVMRCFIICISQLLIEREFRLSPGSSVRELPWEKWQA